MNIFKTNIFFFGKKFNSAIRNRLSYFSLNLQVSNLVAKVGNLSCPVIAIPHSWNADPIWNAIHKKPNNPPDKLAHLLMIKWGTKASNWWLTCSFNQNNKNTREHTRACARIIVAQETFSFVISGGEVRQWRLNRNQYHDDVNVKLRVWNSSHFDNDTIR